MTDTIETANTAKDVAAEIIKVGAKSAAFVVAETAAAIVILAGVGFVANAIQTRRIKKALAVVPAE